MVHSFVLAVGTAVSDEELEVGVSQGIVLWDPIQMADSFGDISGIIRPSITPEDVVLALLECPKVV